MKTIPSMIITIGRSDMKFTYGTKQDERECVAYIDDVGDLMVKDNAGGATALFGDDKHYCEGDNAWEPERAVKKFMVGDKITIEF